jgi:hypothetical protein
LFVSQELHPYYDPHSVLVLRLLAFSASYQPTSDNQIAGTLISTNSKPMDVTDANVLGWTVMPIFAGFVV